MEKIKEELQGILKINAKQRENLMVCNMIENMEKEQVELYGEIQLKTIGTIDRENLQEKYEKKHENIEEIKKEQELTAKKIIDELEKQKNAIIVAIDEEICKYKYTKDENEKLEKAKLENLEKITKELSEYKEKAGEYKKVINSMLEELNMGFRVDGARFNNLRAEYNQEMEKIDCLEIEIEKIKCEKFKSVEANSKEYVDLIDLKNKIIELNINTLEQICRDIFC